mmetsp:Transcript_26929/g.62594  ORF Transcript_26929/g.62594 Transcript_26929/m.62594 type:complete len:414 (-) Transcript_26929:266-1507(-)
MAYMGPTTVFVAAAAPVSAMPANQVMYPQPMGFFPMMAPAPQQMSAECPRPMPAAPGAPAASAGPSPAPKAKGKSSTKKPRNRGEPSRPQKEADSAAGDDEAAGRGVISLLQEFVQCSKTFPAPQHRPILQWMFDTHMADNTNLEFRAQVSFLLDGVPHHIAGSWQQSKKLAQRDTAERCLGLFVGGWGSYLLQSAEHEGLEPRPFEDPLHDLQRFCTQFRPCSSSGPVWCLDVEESHCRATAEMTLLGVRHRFAGCAAADGHEAKRDTARRVLWYLQCPGYENLFEPDTQGMAAVAKEIPTPPANWVNAAEEEKSVLAAERKTTLMRVQNRLQQSFAKRLKPGQGVWEWSFESDTSETTWPPMQRATVTIAVVQKNFTGPWVRGQREAQLEACKLVEEYLDSVSEDLAATDA